ncbi:MAG: zinc ribbon domain-containing protein [Candidatus Brockarchaeota archaeon]|nr:zinc ribbon domain-containing protein [Candidatus Brockarchaeota archaeon]
MPKCQSCGAELPEGTFVCQKCGSAVELPPPPPPKEGAISRERRERYEKEKAEKEKAEKREKEEKHEDRFGAVIGGLILILLGTIMYLAQNRVIPWRNFGGYFLLGMGLILIIWAAARYFSEAFKGTALGLLIGGLILGALGLSTLLELRESWPLVLIMLGLIIIVGIAAAVRRSPRPR